MLSDQFKEAAALLPVVSERELELYERHFTLLKEWNQHIGLVSRKSVDQSFGPHYADSLFIADLARPYVTDAISDVGTGAGFPGMIFAIRYPEISVTLYEKNANKQTFLLAAIAQLGLTNVRLEGAMPSESFSGLFLARAFMQREDLFKFFRQRMAPGSLLVTNLGGKKTDIPIPKGYELVAEKKYSLPLDYGDRWIEIVKRVPRGT